MIRVLGRCCLLLLICATGLPVMADAADNRDWIVAETRDHPLVGTVWDTETRTALQETAAFARLRGATFVLLGEVHDNPAAHGVQARALQALTESGRKPALVWEMVRRPKQTVLDAPPADAQALGTALDWANSGWPEWPLYAPIAQVALDNGLPMRAGDLARAALRTVAQSGLSALPAEIAKIAATPFTDAQRTALLEVLRTGHCNLLDDRMLAPMVPVQQARDAAMTAALRAAAQDADGAVLIAGNGHTRRDWGVPHYLAAVAPDATLVSVGILEVAADEPNAAAHIETDAAGVPVHDLLWFVPRAERADPCTGLAEHMKSRT